MKKIAKSIIYIVLSLSLLVCAIPGSPLSAGAGNDKVIITDSYKTSGLSEYMKNAVAAFMQNAANAVDTENEALIAFADIMTGMPVLSETCSVYNGVMPVLQFTGMAENSAQKVKSILAEAEQLRTEVQKTDKNVAQIQDTLKTELSKTDASFDTEKAASYKKSRSAFLKDDYLPTVDFFKAYQQQTEETAIAWANTWKQKGKTDLRCLYNRNGIVLYSSNNYNGYDKALPAMPKSADDKATAEFDTSVSFATVLPAKYLVTDEAEINANNYIDVIRATVSAAVSKALDEGEITVDAKVLSVWEKAGIKTDEDIAAKITEDTVNSILFAVHSQTANAKYGDGTTYAAEAIDLYENLCAAINGAEGKDKAFKDSLKNLSLTYAFEGDAKASADTYYGFVGTAIMQYGEFTSMLAALNKGVSADKKTALYKLTADTLNSVNKTYEAFITGNDNYCYPLKSVVTYTDVKAQSVIQSYNDYYYENRESAKKYNAISDWAVVDASIDFDMTDLDVYQQETKENEAVLREAMLGPDDLIRLSCYIKASGSEDMTVFDYLKQNGVIASEGHHSATLLAPDFTVEDQPLVKTLYKCLPFAYDDYESTAISDEPLPGYDEGKYATVIEDVDYDYPAKVHDKLVGTTFSMDKSIAEIDTEYKGEPDTPLGIRILQCRADLNDLPAAPRYFLYDDHLSDVTLTVSENAADPEKGFQYQEAYRCTYTVKAEKAYGALCVDYSKDNGSSYEYDKKIKSKDEFISFLKDIANGNTYEGKRILLTTDIDFAGVNPESYWPNADCKYEFKGHFNGNGKTVKNITSNAAGDRAALFRTTGNGAVIENLKLENVNISAADEHEAAAALVGFANGNLTVKNVQVLGGTLNGYKFAGGIVGEANKDVKIILINCENNAEITAANVDAGGMVGNAGEVYIRGCVNNGKVTAGCGCAGGMAGYTNKNAVVKNSQNTGKIVTEATAGGLIGTIGSNSKWSYVSDNKNTGAVKALSQGSAGGIVGWTNAGGSYIGNTNNAAVTCESASGFSGGILGGNENDPILIKYNTNAGSVTGMNKTGGIAGFLGNSNRSDIVIADSNINSGKIEATSAENGDAGGIIGTISTENPRHEITANTNTGEVTAQRQAGGIIGQMSGGGRIEANTNSADIISLSQNAGGIIGRSRDIECKFKDSAVKGKTVAGAKNAANGYQISAKSTNMHAGKICGWDGYKEAVIISDSGLASVFGQRSVLIIIALVVLLVAAAVAVYVISKNRKHKTTEPPLN